MLPDMKSSAGDDQTPAAMTHVELAKILLAHERACVPREPNPADATERVYAALSRTLTPIIGAAGTDALFVRSVKLARAECPSLANVVVAGAPSDSDARVAGSFVACLRELEPGVGTEAAERLFAVLLRLLTNFIGEALVSQILQKAFPGIASTQPKEII